MMQSKLSHVDFRDLINDLAERHRHLSEDELFVLWLLTALITDSERQATDAIVGGSGDKGVDAVLIDDDSRVVVVVQGKYRRKLNASSEKRADVLEFARWGPRICEFPDREFAELISNMAPLTAERILEGRRRVLGRGYRLSLYYVTLGKCSMALKKEFLKTARPRKGQVSIEIIDGTRCMLLLRDYLDGAAPPVPSLDLEMEKGKGITVNGVLQRYDGVNEIESWVFPMSGSAVARLYEHAGVRLFARNIRGFLGRQTDVNAGMAATLDVEADHFFYYNNGITIICDDAEKRSSKGRDYITLSNPQVINGQQTTRVLWAHERAAKATVLIKVIRVPRTGEGLREFDSLVRRIVAGTNWQNTIRPSDLMSNDSQQIEIERALRKCGYVYLRKRQTKGEAKRLTGARARLMIKKEDLARAVAGCDLDPVIVRSGKERLFEETLYQHVFPNADPSYYLPRYWLLQQVTSASRGYPERGYAKWLVLNFVWSKLAPLVSGKERARSFWEQCERDMGVVVSLSQCIGKIFRVALAYYRANRGTGPTAVDISAFFRTKKGRDKEFARFWKSANNRSRASFDKAWGAVRRAVSTPS